MSDQPGMTASNCPPSMIATPSPSSNHSARSVLASNGGLPAGCLVCAAGISGAWPAVSRDRSALCGACSWLAIHAAPSTAPASCRYAAVVAPSYSTTSRRLPYGLSLSSTVPGWPPNVADRGLFGRLRIEDMPEIYRFLTILQWNTGKAMSSLPLVFAAPRRGQPPRHLADLSAQQRAAAVAALGEKPLRARQLSRHYFARLSVDAPSMTDIPQQARAALVTGLLPPLLTEVRSVTCDDGATSKSLWRAYDGTLLESVVMRYAERATVCVSSQAGCGMACPFCATGQGGLRRNLSTAEIVDQVVAAARSTSRGELLGGPARL